MPSSQSCSPFQRNSVTKRAPGRPCETQPGATRKPCLGSPVAGKRRIRSWTDGSHHRSINHPGNRWSWFMPFGHDCHLVTLMIIDDNHSLVMTRPFLLITSPLNGLISWGWSSWVLTGGAVTVSERHASSATCRQGSRCCTLLVLGGCRKRG